MSTCCTIMQMSKASTTAYCWIFHSSVFQTPIQVMAATSVGKGPDTPLPSRYHQLLGRFEISKCSQAIWEIQTLPLAAAFRPDGHDRNTSQGRPGPQIYPKRLIFMWRLPFELLPEIWAPHPLPEAEFARWLLLKDHDHSWSYFLQL